MATMSARLPPLSGPPLMLDSASRRMSLRRFLNALRACLRSCGPGVPAASVGCDMIGSSQCFVLWQACEYNAATGMVRGQGSGGVRHLPGWVLLLGWHALRYSEGRGGKF